MNLAQCGSLLVDVSGWLMILGGLLMTFMAIYSTLKPKIRGRKLSHTELVKDALVMGIFSFVMALGLVFMFVGGALQDPTGERLLPTVLLSIPCLINITLAGVFTFVVYILRASYVEPRLKK